RPDQVGPEQGMGCRENAQGLDLNRDFTKLECPETRALVRLIDSWNPDVLIDTHTTDGSWHRYALTYATTQHPAAPDATRRFVAETMLPEIRRRLDDRELATFWYGNFDRDHTRWSGYGTEPRYGVEYMGVRGRIGILSESYAHMPYRRRIDATRSFVLECLSHLAEHRPAVR